MTRPLAGAANSSCRDTGSWTEDIIQAAEGIVEDQIKLLVPVQKKRESEEKWSLRHVEYAKASTKNLMRVTDSILKFLELGGCDAGVLVGECSEHLFDAMHGIADARLFEKRNRPKRQLQSLRSSFKSTTPTFMMVSLIPGARSSTKTSPF